MGLNPRLEGQESEAAAYTLVSMDSCIYIGTCDWVSQIPSSSVCPMRYLNRSVALVAFVSPNPSELCLLSNWRIPGLFPEPKVKLSIIKTHKKSSFGLYELEIKSGQVFLWNVSIVTLRNWSRPFLLKARACLSSGPCLRWWAGDQFMEDTSQAVGFELSTGTHLPSGRDRHGVKLASSCFWIIALWKLRKAGKQGLKVTLQLGGWQNIRLWVIRIDWGGGANVH